jgi:pyrroline-5-carboxylate reductase
MKKIGFIGAGNMASAIISSLLNAGTDAGLIAVSDKNEERLKEFAKKGLNVFWENSETAKRSDIIILAVKPQNMNEVLPSIKSCVEGKTVVSIVAGVRTDRIRSALDKPLAVIRVMPNTPMLLEKGTVAIAFGEAGADIKDEITKIFSGCGEVFEVSEDKMDAVTALSGSGPAYFYRIAEVLARSAHTLGLDYEIAVRMAASTMAGAAEMMKKSGKTPAELIKDVTSPGGTTLAALLAFDKSGLDDALREGFFAAESRSKELGK